jgi:hypothetical protein
MKTTYSLYEKNLTLFYHYFIEVAYAQALIYGKRLCDMHLIILLKQGLT